MNNFEPDFKIENRLIQQIINEKKELESKINNHQKELDEQLTSSLNLNITFSKKINNKYISVLKEQHSKRIVQYV